MGFKCKIFGHKFNYYKEDVEHQFSISGNSFGAGSASFTMMINTQFRICERCQYKQERKHHTGGESDWFESDLSVKQLRNKKLEELGI